MSENFYDKVYDAWRSGYNPDLVSEDLYDDYLSQGFEPDEISWKMVYPKPKQKHPERSETYGLSEKAR